MSEDEQNKFYVRLNIYLINKFCNNSITINKKEWGERLGERATLEIKLNDDGTEFEAIASTGVYGSL